MFKTVICTVCCSSSGVCGTGDVGTIVIEGITDVEVTTAGKNTMIMHFN